MGYSFGFKEEMIRKVLSGRRVQEIAVEAGIAEWSLRRWIKQRGNCNLMSEKFSPRGFSLIKKHSLVLESLTLTEENLGEWLRKNGIHSDHLIKWKEEIMDAMETNTKEKTEIKKLQEDIFSLKKEIERKDKALAEAAILLTLKKKYSHLWEGEEK